MEKLNALDVCTGYAGISTALRKYSRPVLYCEIEAYAQGMLISRMVDGDVSFAPIWSDLRTLDGRPLRGLVDLIAGGTPCQGFSEAGVGRGMEDERSGLIKHVFRLTKEINPTFVFLENVPGIRTKGLREVVRAFAKMGYDCRWTHISASAVGANHERERWFLLAKYKGEEMAHTHSERLWREAIAAAKEDDQGIWENSRGPKATAAVSSWWETEPDVGRVDDGTPFRLDRAKALGNGVVPLQVQTAFERLMGLI
jgi:DNA (cytosine-5)-methyltransferase 1